MCSENDHTSQKKASLCTVNTEVNNVHLYWFLVKFWLLVSEALLVILQETFDLITFSKNVKKFNACSENLGTDHNASFTSAHWYVTHNGILQD